MLIHGKTQKEHDERVLAVLKKLDGGGATLNPEKCEFLKEKSHLLDTWSAKMA